MVVVRTTTWPNFYKNIGTNLPLNPDNDHLEISPNKDRNEKPTVVWTIDHFGQEVGSSRKHHRLDGIVVALSVPSQQNAPTTGRPLDAGHQFEHTAGGGEADLSR